MRFRKLTDVDDYHIKTLWWYIAQGHWKTEVTWKNWGLSWKYVWYDGPNWQLQVGPFGWFTRI